MEETHNIEYKRQWRDEWLQWICGFANAEGGIINIGLDDHGNPVGLDKIKKLMEDIPSKIRSCSESFLTSSNSQRTASTT